MMDARISVPARVAVQQVGDELVILDLDAGVYFGLDAVGRRIWQLLSSGLTLAETCAQMLGEFDVTRETVERDVVALVGKLQAQNLVELVPGRNEADASR